MTATEATRPIPGSLVHEGACYRDAAELLALPVPFLRDGLTRGAPVLVALLAPAVLADAYRTHPVLVDGAGRRPSPTFAPEQA
ncbi:hypothetical protein AB0I37_12540 [Micromonospora purpureochromogenes]|uniref:hypothetical protein n=1 Tax=Micromonospora purpureochromogenes TaxID=47872 RepID=UPI0033C7C389